MSVEANTPVAPVEMGQYLTFFLGGEEYGVDILKVREIRSWEKATQIPNTPEYVLGVINLRGIVVPLVDLRLRFSLSKAEFGPMTVVIIVKVDNGSSQRTVGMVVDAISDVYDILEDEVRATPDFGSVMDTKFIKGLATVDEKMVVILNVDMLINTGVLDIQQEPENINADIDV